MYVIYSNSFMDGYFYIPFTVSLLRLFSSNWLKRLKVLDIDAIGLQYLLGQRSIESRFMFCIDTHTL